jgi:uncharacterized protein (DUF849 family)
VSTPAQLRAGAKRITELGVKAELEIFDTGHLWFAKQMIKEGLLDDPLFQLCLGIPWGAPADTTTMKAMVDNLPADAPGPASASAACRCRWPRRRCCWAATCGWAGRQPVAGPGVLASNGQLVERAGDHHPPGRPRADPGRRPGKMNLKRR